MIRTFYLPANELDLKATANSCGSLVSNLLVVSLPLSAVLFAGAYFALRSIFVAGLISGGFLE